MRCRSLILRNGYFTGNKCSKDARWVVTLQHGHGISSVDWLCTQHKNIKLANLERSGYLKRADVTFTVEEIPK